MFDTWEKLLILAIFVSIMALWKPNELLAILTAAAWIAVLSFHISNLPTNITQGDTTDNTLIVVFAVLIIAIPVWTVSRVRSRRKMEKQGYYGDGGGMMKVEGGRGNISSLSNMTPEEYQRFLRRRMSAGRRRR